MSSQIKQIAKNSKDPKFIEEVFNFAKETYKDRKWLGGEDYYIDHATRMALILSDMALDEATVAASLLYGVADTSLLDMRKSIVDEIEKRFGKELSALVQRTSELNKIYYSFRINTEDQKPLTEKKSDDLRKMFFAIAKDLRVILIKIASRVDGLERLDHLSEENKKRYATETLQIFVPIANRLGLGEIKRKLEDMAFACLFEDKFNWLQENIKEKYEERKEYLQKFMPKLKKVLSHEKIKFSDINFRAKSYWSTYQKLQRHNMDFEKIYDLVALRLVVKDIATCYKALGIIHKYYQPMSGQIQDYIAKPKENGYKSLHTTVFLEDDTVSEIQIKTEKMHQEAQFGICAHWAYKEKINLKKDQETLKFSEKIPEFLKTFNIDFFEDQIFAFTPKGDIITLPKGSTPIDFAYAIHSDVGDHCDSAKIDGKIIPLSQTLNNGDIVEIIVNKKRKPSQDWIRFVKTNFAKVHIKRATLIKIPSAIFSIPGFLKKKIFGTSEKAKKEVATGTQAPKEKPLEIYLASQKGMMVSMAKCCLPQAGDPAKAYITRYRAAVLHKNSCKNLERLSKLFPEKIIDATWKQS